MDNTLTNVFSTQYPYMKKRIQSNVITKCNDTPHQTHINNLKTNKYFTMNKYDTKVALNEYSKHIQNKPQQHNKTHSITLLHKDIIINSTEPRSTRTQSYKLKPKFENDNSSDSDDNEVIDNNDDDDDFNENKPVKQQTSTRSTTYNISSCSHKQLNEDSLVSSNNTKGTVVVDNVINDIQITNDFDFETLLTMETYLNELVEDIEINKMKIFQNILDIIDDLLKCYNNKAVYDNVLKVFDSSFDLNNKHSIQKICKDFHIILLIFLYILLLLNFVKVDSKTSYHPGIKNLSFYLHQNFIVFMYIIITQYNSSNTEKNNNNSIHLCNNKISNNKTWLSKSNYKQYIISNNKKCKSTLKNIINELRLHFQSTFNGIKITTPSNTTIELETTFNIFTSYLKSLHTITLQSVITTLHSLNEMNTLFQLSKTKAHTPILQAKLPSCKQQYTLVLDLDETLVHFVQGDDDSNDIVQIRPGAEQFIEDLAEYYEIIIFTVAKQDYADIVIDGVDSSRKVSGRLYRNHTIRLGDGYVKDLSKLGRDLTKTLIVDNCAENFRLQPNNGLRIKDFEGDPEDNELEYLKEDLIELVMKQPNDVREWLNDIQRKMDEREQCGNDNDNDNDECVEETNESKDIKEIKDKNETTEHEQEDTSDQEENVKDNNNSDDDNDNDNDDNECKIENVSSY